MIEKLIIKNFKAHKTSPLDFSRLNVLTGKNGMGKTSIIQALLLLRQSYFSQRRFEGVILNGDLVSIGNYQDALCEASENDEIEFTLTASSRDMEFVCQKNLDKNYLPLKKSIDENAINSINLFTSKFQYLAAEHLAASEFHSRNTYYVEQLNQISEKNGDCKFTVHYLAVNSGKKIPFKELAHPSQEDLSLKLQVDAWLSEITTNIIVKPQEEPNQNSVSLKYVFETPLGQSKEFRPENVGFGISYILPLLVALLSAERDTLIIAENPEAHLHPGGQAVVGRLLCLAAKCGVQLIIETHSDHIINGILVSVNQNSKVSEAGISSSLIKMYFIDRPKESNISNVQKITVESNGRIKNPPSGFFDQFSRDMKAIMGF